MAYQQGDTITATDYNNFVANVNVVIGTGTGDQGYGLNEVATVSVGSTITATQWNNLLTGLQNGANHQGYRPNLPLARVDPIPTQKSGAGAEKVGRSEDSPQPVLGDATMARVV